MEFTEKEVLKALTKTVNDAYNHPLFDEKFLENPKVLDSNILYKIIHTIYKQHS